MIISRRVWSCGPLLNLESDSDYQVGLGTPSTVTAGGSSSRNIYFAFTCAYTINSTSSPWLPGHSLIHVNWQSYLSIYLGCMILRARQRSPIFRVNMNMAWSNSQPRRFMTSYSALGWLCHTNVTVLVGFVAYSFYLCRLCRHQSDSRLQTVLIPISGVCVFAIDYIAAVTLATSLAPEAIWTKMVRLASA